MSAIGGIGSSGFNPVTFTEKAQERFNQADTDQSGTVTKDEFLSQTEKVNAPFSPEKMFDKMDRNGDGILSQEEHQAAVDKMAERMQAFAGQGIGQTGEQNGFDLLLDALSNADLDQEKASEIRSKLEEAKANQGEEGLVAKALEQFNTLYPPIDISI